MVAEYTRINPFAELHSVKSAKPCIIGTVMADSEIDSFLMAYHMSGQIAGLKVVPTVIDLDGRPEEVFAIPMLGGGLRVSGNPDRKVIVECSFIGSNVLLEAGAYIGFGCFVLGRLRTDEGLLPFTVSTDSGPEKDQIGGALISFVNIMPHANMNCAL